MRCAQVRCLVLALLWVCAAAGCWPNRVAVSPDGRTMYFSLNKEGGVKTEDGSNIYALDVETAELRQLTDAPYAEGWCALSKDGKRLVHSAAAGTLRIAWIDLEKGKDRPFSLLVTGVEKAYLYPYFVHERGILAMEREDVKDEKGRWILFGEGGAKALPLPEGFLAVPGEVAVIENRFACAVVRELALPEGGDDAPSQVEVAVYVVPLSEPVEEKEGEEVEKEEGSAPPEDEKGAEEPAPKVKATCVGQWEVEKAQPVDLAFSPDGKRLVAAVSGAGASDEHTGFFELDPAGEAEPKPLFEAKKAFYPQWAPDGEGIVYLRTHPEDDEWREVMLWRPEADEPQVLARLPGKTGEAYTTWRWMEDGRMRIYHLSDEGVRIVDAKPDGSEAAAKRLPRENLRVLKALADLERAVARVPDLSEEQWPEPFAEKVKAVAEPLKQTFGSLEDPFKQAVEGARVWESVPAVPAVAPADTSATRNISAR